MITANNSPNQSPVRLPVAPARNLVSADFNFFDILAILKRQWGLILFGIFLGLVLGALYCAKTERLYESKAMLSVVENNPDAFKVIGDASSSYFAGMKDDVLTTHTLFFTGDWVINKACTDLKKLNDTKRLSCLYESERDGGSMYNYIKDGIEVVKGGEGKLKTAKVLCVSFTSPSKEETQIVLTYLVKAYMEYVNKTYADPTRDIAKMYEETREDFTKQVDQLSSEISDFVANAPPAFISLSKEGSSMYQQKLEAYETDLTKLVLEQNKCNKRLEEIDKVVANKTLDQIDNRDAVAVLLLGDDTIVKDMQTMMSQENAFLLSVGYKKLDADQNIQKQEVYKKLIERKLERSRLLIGLGAERDEVRLVDRDIEILDDIIKNINLVESGFAEREKIMTNPELLLTYRDIMSKKLNELTGQIDAIQKMVDKERERASAFVRWSEEYNALLNTRDMKKMVLSETMRKLTDHTAMQSSVGFSIDALAAPTESKLPVWPNIPIVMAIAIICGMMLGGALAYLVDLSDKTFHSPAEVAATIGIPVLAQLQKLHSVQRKRKWLRSPKRAGAIAEEVITHHKPKSQESETFRGLRTSLLVGLKLGDHSVLQVTSTNPHDGKTTVATNLSVSIANSKRRVLLVDCDLRSPNLHSIFGIANGNGLSNYLYGEKTFEEILLATPVENLTLVTAGTSRVNPAEMLSSPTFKKFLEEAREKFDLVVIDTPPVLAVSDACITASEVDGVLMTVRITKNGRPAVLHATHLLRDVGTTILGVVINNFRSHRFYNSIGGQSGYGSYGYDYSYGYGYSYGYSYGSDSEPSSSAKSSKSIRSADQASKSEKTAVS